MHTTTHNGITFHHNGDYSGDVIVARPIEGLAHAAVEVEVPFEALEALVADKLRDELLTRLEDMDPPELFGFLARGLSA